MSTSERYRFFAEVEAAGSSPTYEGVALAVADDETIIERLDQLPPAKRQPNLLFAACRYLDAPMANSGDTLEFIRCRWADLRSLMRDRATQTNEPARTGAFVPILVGLDQPVALIEVGASAGLCLYPDRYQIRYDDHPVVGPADSPVRIEVSTDGPVPVPSRSPDVVWRAGVDLNPLDARDPDDMAWLLACVWPEHTERRQRLVAAAAIAAKDPPELIAGNLLDHVGDLINAVPDGAVPVVFHSAVLNYLDPSDRKAFARIVRSHEAAVWISNEGPGVVDAVTTPLRPPSQAMSKAFFVVALNGARSVAISDPHGRWLSWREAQPS